MSIITNLLALMRQLGRVTKMRGHNSTTYCVNHSRLYVQLIIFKKGKP